MNGFRRAVALAALICTGNVLASTQTKAAAPALTETQRRFNEVEACLPSPVVVTGERKECVTLKQEMAEFHVTGVSIAVIHQGKIEWARGYGVQQVGGRSVTPETLFQAGSISKPVAAMAALHQVQIGKLTLDGNVDHWLTSWKIPSSSATPGAVVTLRELLTHTAGFNVHGFPGYAANTPVPSLIQVLDGEKPANSPAIRIESPPGSRWQYSGGGYTVMQQMMIDVSKEPFAKLLHDTVLAPIGMTHSTYDQPLPVALRPMAAVPYEADGKPVGGGAHTYPELAAAGLWTTPSDLARYIIENQRSLQGNANHVLSKTMTAQMMTPGKGSWGLGVEIGGSPSDRYFTHDGVNEGFESLFVGYEHGGEGAVVMTNAQGGSKLAEALMRSIAAVYGWPDFRPSVRTIVKVSPNILQRYVGTYVLSPDFDLVITLNGDQLFAQPSHQRKYRLFSESPTKFFAKAVNVQTEFSPDKDGKVSRLAGYYNGRKFLAIKK